MTDLFLIICVVSVVFFLIFLGQCSRPTSKSASFRRRCKTNPAVRRPAESQPVDAAGGRRFFVDLEEQTSKLLSVHGRTVAMLLVLITLPLLVPFSKT